MPDSSAPLIVGSIVEGHGEVEALPPLLERIGRELLGRTVVGLRPYRKPANAMTSASDDVIGVAKLAYERAKATAGVHQHCGLLILVDSDGQCPATLLEPLRSRLNGMGIPASFVVAHHEYETWFVAAAESLNDELLLPGNFRPVEDPEQAGQKKRWIPEHIQTPTYSETVDQAKLSRAMDLELCRRRSPSFGKLCREVEQMFAK